MAKTKGGIDIDRGWKRIAKRARQPKVSAKVGIQAPEAEATRKGGITNVLLGMVHEFGSERVPERSHFRSTFDEKQKDYQAELDRIAQAMLDGARLKGEMLLLGEEYRADVLDKIRSSIPPPLADVTVERKGGETTPLIDTGQYLNSIRVVVTTGEAGGRS